MIAPGVAALVDEHAARPFLVDGRTGLTLTYAEASAQASGLAAALRDAGLEPGDRVLVDLPNSVELALLYLAAIYARVVVVPVGPGFGRRELAGVVAGATPSLAFADASSRVALACEQAGVRVVEGLPDAGTFEPSVDLEGIAAVHFTSGTTGVPRGVAHRVSSFLDNGRRFAATLGLDATHRFHAILPMTYLGGYYNLLLLPFSIGASVVVDASFGAPAAVDYWRVPSANGVDVIWFPPTVMAMLLELDRGVEGRQYVREHVRLAITGMAPLRPELRSRFEQEYGITVHENYGLAETLLATSSTPENPSPLGVAGGPLPGVELRTAGDEILISTPDLFAGYLDADATRLAPPELVDGRWLRTGDLGHLDTEGIRITGRAKEIIIRGGFNISGREVELALEDEPGVRRLAAVPVPHHVLGEQVAVVVSCLPGVTLEELEPRLRQRAADQLDPIAQPAVYLEIDEFPLTTTGKMRKPRLAELVADRLGAVPRPSPTMPARVQLALDEETASALRDVLRREGNDDRLSGLLAELDAGLDG